MLHFPLTPSLVNGDPILHPFKSEFLKFEIFVSLTADLDQILAHSNAKRFVDSEPTNLIRQFVHDYQISRLMIRMLAKF